MKRQLVRIASQRIDARLGPAVVILPNLPRKDRLPANPAAGTSDNGAGYGFRIPVVIPNRIGTPFPAETKSMAAIFFSGCGLSHSSM